jgi:hypothetical protein
MAGFRLQDHADAFAAAQLIPRRYESRLGQLETESDVFLFAEEVGIPPGIVVGRCRERGSRPRIPNAAPTSASTTSRLATH